MAGKRRTLLWTGPALEDLREIRAYVAEDDPAAARRLAHRLRDSVTMLGDNPLAGRTVPELEGMGLREVIVTPYRIVYEARPRHVIIVRVWHGRRDLTARAVQVPQEPEPKSGPKRRSGKTRKPRGPGA